MLLFFPAKDPALIGRCYRRLKAPRSGPIKDQNLRVVVAGRLSDIAAAFIEVAVAISHVLLRFGVFLQAAEDIAACKILLGITEVFPGHAEILSGFTQVTVVVAAAAMAAMMVMTMMVVVVAVVLVIEQIVQEPSDETSRETWQHAEHSAFSIVARDARVRLMPTLRCLLTV